MVTNTSSETRSEARKMESKKVWGKYVERGIKRDENWKSNRIKQWLWEVEISDRESHMNTNRDIKKVKWKTKFLKCIKAQNFKVDECLGVGHLVKLAA